VPLRCSSCGASIAENSVFCPRCGVRIAPPADPLINRIIAGRYRIVELIGEGGMGRVYAAEQSFGMHVRRVAVKLLLPQYAADPVISSRFTREVGLASQLEHPHTVRVYDSGRTEAGELFVVMELLSGESLSTALGRGPVPLHRALRILGQVSSALADAHRRGIVHRDIKPDNIFLTSIVEGDDFAKILDFGIAKHHQAAGDTKLTHVGEVLGTLPYMSPEHFGSGDVDRRSDIYSLGVVAFEMLTGQLPFSAEGVMQWATTHATKPPAAFDLTPAGRAVPYPVQAAIQRALAKRPMDRPQTIEIFYAEMAGEHARLSDVGWLHPVRSQAALPAGPAPAAPATGTIVATAQRPEPSHGGPGGAHPSAARPANERPMLPPRRPLSGWIIALIAALLGLVGTGVFFLVSGGASSNGGSQAPTSEAPTEPTKPLPAKSLASVVPVPTEAVAPVKDPRPLTLAAIDAIVVELALAHDDAFDPKHATAINDKIAEMKTDPAFTTASSPKLAQLMEAFPTGLAAQGKKFAAACAERDLNDALEHHDNLLRLVRQIRPLREAMP